VNFENYVGKRFAGLILCAGLTGIAYFFGPEPTFATLATTLGLMFGAYVGGQSYTDGKNPK
jgi:hypothetical protein